MSTKSVCHKIGKKVTRGVGLDFSVEEEVFLLALHINCPFHPNTDYVAKLKDYYDRDVSALNILNWFQKCYEYAVMYKVPNLVPILDKWIMRNATRVMAFHAIMDMLPDHSRWNFLDKKHLMYGDMLLKKVCANPFTEYVDAIPVSGDFWDAHNMFAVVSASPIKKKSMAYHITKENVNATQFVTFIKMLIISGCFEHYGILFMDNARIHTAGKAKCVEYYLWNMLCDGVPLHAKIVYLPTRCPELNPIKFMFHLLTDRVRSFWYRILGAIDREIVALIGRVFDFIKYEIIVKTYVHCGYFHSRAIGVE
jgi:hypothetical protein